MNKQIRIALALAVLLITVCSTIRGAGKTITESRQVSDFNRVSLTDSGELVITQGAEESLTVEANVDIMPYIRTEVRNGTLILGLEHHSLSTFFRSTGRIKYYLSMRNINSLDVSGSGSISAESVETDYLKIKVSGSGDVALGPLDTEELRVTVSGSGDCDVSGEAREQEIRISGSGEYYAPKLNSETVTVRISGSGEATVQVRESLDVNISGSGEVNYYGSPSVVSKVMGSGKVHRLGSHRLR